MNKNWMYREFFLQKKKKKRKSGETKSLDKNSDVGKTKICWNTDLSFSVSLGGTCISGESISS